MNRINADHLVGLPSSTQRKYSAAETKGVDMKVLRFRKRLDAGHFSMYVRGFKSDIIEEVAEVALHGHIPTAWADLAGWDSWEDAEGAPPEPFWRTLVANRGSDGRDIPAYYPWACQESFREGGSESGAIVTSALISWGYNSPVAQFCRRVQAVTWNRALVRTGSGAIGLVSRDVQKNDLVCILYGCSVPVILRECPEKTETEFEGEMEHELIDVKSTVVQKLRQYSLRKRRHEARKDKEMAQLCQVWLRTTDYMRSHGIDSAKMSAKDKQNPTGILLRILKQAIADFKCWLSEERERAWPAIRIRIVEKMKERKEYPNRTASRPGKKETDENLRRQTARKRRQSLGAATMLGRITEAPATTEGATSAASKEGPTIIKKKKPLVDWWEFELALVAGRRWLQMTRREKANRINFAVQYSEQLSRQKQHGEYEAIRMLILKENKKKVERETDELISNLMRERGTYGGDVTGGHQIANKEIEIEAQTTSDDEHRRSGDASGNSHDHEDSDKPGSTEQPGKTERETVTYDGDHKTEEEPQGNRETPQASSSLSRSTSVTGDTPSNVPATIRPSWRRTVKRTKLTESEAIEYMEKVKMNLRERLGDEGYFSYILLGECYIHGMMDGEAIQHQNEEVIPSMVFEIR